MDLHRSENKPDWEKIPPEDWNRWQKLAARTHGWITPANAITALGFICSAAGMYQLDKDNHKSGLALLAFGRTLDLGDGKISDLQGTKSGKGEALDAGGDNLLAQIALRVARRKELIPRPALNLLAAGRVIVNGSSMVAKARGNEIHPSLGGKFGGFDFWAASCAYVVAKYTEGVVSKAAEAVGDVALGGYLVHGTIIAGYDYLNDAFPELRLHERGQDAHAALAVEYVDDGLVTGFDALD